LAVSKVTNLHRTLERAKEAGYWIIGTDADSTHAYTAPLYDRPIVLLIGGEGSGMRSSTRKACDAIVSIPLLGALSSLNASVAAGVVLFEIARQRSLAP
jgi:23S rRNA (guanosine2251-2'-O)-methyltransferase